MLLLVHKFEFQFLVDAVFIEPVPELNFHEKYLLAVLFVYSVDLDDWIRVEAPMIQRHVYFDADDLVDCLIEVERLLLLVFEVLFVNDNLTGKKLPVVEDIVVSVKSKDTVLLLDDVIER